MGTSQLSTLPVFKAVTIMLDGVTLESKEQAATWETAAGAIFLKTDRTMYL